ncbi:hypothetical protein [Luteipulveratus halotolerans]|uniref:hypothetical protein n=1 Tax=Luteipulveratus halotolerans TaxID=1631356 RepID=UPI0012FABDC2|nr:hypothetical protein [Luteipulveratus halotolerans]
MAWKKEPAPKSVVKDDLLYSLNSIMTVFNPARNNAGERVVTLFETGEDPGNKLPSPQAPGTAARTGDI